MILASALIGGGVGVGLAILVVGLAPGRPALAPALQRLSALPESAPAPRGPRLLANRYLRIPRQDLALLGRSVESYIATKLAYVLLGLMLPSLLGLLMWAAGINLPIYIPAGASLLLAAVFYVTVDIDLKQKATRARRDFRYAIASYLDLVALQLSVGRGVFQALEDSAAVGAGWVFERLKEAFDRARWEQRPPWDALRQVGEDIDLPTLADLGAIMQLSGEEGAQVYNVLRSLAEGLRAEILAEEQNRANSTTTILSIPSTALLAVLLALATYPLVARLLFG